MDKASVFGTEDCRCESYSGHLQRFRGQVFPGRRRARGLTGFIGLVVMTFALHAKGPQFKPGMKYTCWGIAVHRKGVDPDLL